MHSPTVTVEYTKTFHSGILQGITIREKMPFVSAIRARQWFDACKDSPLLVYKLESPVFTLHVH